MRSSAQSDAFCLTKEKAWPVPSEQLAHRTYAPTSSDAHEREAAGSVICTARPGTCEELVAETREETCFFGAPERSQSIWTPPPTSQRWWVNGISVHVASAGYAFQGSRFPSKTSKRGGERGLGFVRCSTSVVSSEPSCQSQTVIHGKSCRLVGHHLLRFLELFKPCTMLGV